MSDVQETQLPGVGVRYDFLTSEGDRIGVLAHHFGHRELLLYDRDDPDSSRRIARLDPDDARTLADLLGVPHISQQLEGIQQRIEGLAIDWMPIDKASSFAGRTLRQCAIHTRTGVSIVAVLRGDEAFPAPTADFVLEPDDIAVAVGTPAGVKALHQLRRGQ